MQPLQPMAPIREPSSTGKDILYGIWCIIKFATYAALVYTILNWALGFNTYNHKTVGFVPTLIMLLITFLAIFAGQKEVRRQVFRKAAPVVTVDEPMSVDVQAQAMASEPLISIKPDSLVLQPGEVCYLQEPAALSILQNDVHRTGGMGGVSIPVGHGIRVRTGSFDSHNRSEIAWSAPVNGRVYVTNFRGVFLGASNNTFGLATILQLEKYSDGVALGFTSGNPMRIMTGNPRIWITLEKVINRATEPTHPLPQ